MAQDPQFNEPPTSPASPASPSSNIGPFVTSGGGNYNTSVRPEDFAPNSETDPFSVEDLLDQLQELDLSGTQEDVVAAVNAGETSLSILICHSPCNSSGNYSVQASASGRCPASHPFLVAPDCSEAKDSLDALMDLFRQQQEALEEAQSNNDSQETETLRQQLADLQMQIELAEMQPEPKQAGFGNIPNWAILSGLGLVALIVILTSQRPARVATAK